MIGLVYFFGIALFFGGLFWSSIFGIIIAVAVSVFIGAIALSLVVVFWRFIAIALLIFLGLFVTFLISEFPELIVLILFGVFVLGLCVFYFGENKDVENENRQAEIESIKHLGKNPHYR